MKKLMLITIVAILGLSSCQKLSQKEYTVKVEIVGDAVISPGANSYYSTLTVQSDHFTDISLSHPTTSYEISFKDDKRNKIKVLAFSENTTHIMLYQGDKLLKETTKAIDNQLVWTNAE